MDQKTQFCEHDQIKLQTNLPQVFKQKVFDKLTSNNQNNVLKRKKVGASLLSDFKGYNKYMVIKTVRYWHQTNTFINRT